MSAAERLARRVHDGWLDGDGAPYVAHLERVAALTASFGGDAAALEAAWLHGVARAGVPLSSLPAQGVSRRAVGLLQVLAPRPDDNRDTRERRAGEVPGAAEVLRADVVDGIRAGVLAALSPGERDSRLFLAREALVALGAPLPDAARDASPPWPMRVEPAPSRPAADVPSALAALADDDPRVVRDAMHALFDAGVAEPFEALAVLVHRHGEAWRHVRHRAIRLLLSSDDPRAWRELVTAAATSGELPGAARIAAKAPRSLLPEIVALLTGPGFAPAQAALILTKWRPPPAEAAGPLAATIAAPDTGGFVALRCLDALEVIGLPGAGPGLLAGAHHGDPEVRARALAVMRRLGFTAAVDVAVRAADDVDPGLRREAVRLLAAGGDERALVPLLRACEGGPSARYALRGLARLGDPRAVPTLVEVFTAATDRRVRDLAGRALVRCAPPGMLLPGVRPDAWSDPPLTRATAWVLGRVGGTTGPWWLTRALTFPDPVTRARAAASLGLRGDPAAAEPLRTALADVDRRVRANAATALGRLGVPEAAEWLAAPLADADRNVRAAAAAAIRRLTGGPPP